MEGTPTKKSTSLETLVIQNFNNVNDIKAKLSEIIAAGACYKYDVSSSLKDLLRSRDESIVVMSTQAVSELAKCEEKRKAYAQKEIIEPILGILSKDLCMDKFDLVKQCLRALGNLCCDCDVARKIFLENNGVYILKRLMSNTSKVDGFDQLQVFICKTILNYAIGGKEFTESLDKCGIIEQLKDLLQADLKNDDMNDDLVSCILLILNVMIDFVPEFLFSDEMNTCVLNVLKETTNIEISELCLEHLHCQVQEFDSVKTLIAKEGGVELVCTRLEQLLQRHEAGELNSDDIQVDTIVKMACNLIILVLTGDEAMPLLYKDGMGEVYLTMVKWLDSTNYHLLNTALLAIGNFARRDAYCIHMMNDKIFDKLLDIFEAQQRVVNEAEAEADSTCAGASSEGTGANSGVAALAAQAQHAALAGVRNLCVPRANKSAPPAARAPPRLLAALPAITDHHVAYKLLAALRMLVDGQVSAARAVLGDERALAAVARWGGAGGAGDVAGAGGAAAEAPRLLAWALRTSPRPNKLLEVDGCVQCLVNMLIAPHTVMQNEAILALTLLALEAREAAAADALSAQLHAAEVGKHLAALVETNCAKLPAEVAANLLALLSAAGGAGGVPGARAAGVPGTLRRLAAARPDYGDQLRARITDTADAIARLDDDGDE